jgi:hypothetical protein
MKQPDDTFAGSSRKTLLKRSVRKSKTPVSPRKPASRTNTLSPELEEELVKMFGEK